jgi:hypothetical protein
MVVFLGAPRGARWRSMVELETAQRHLSEALRRLEAAVMRRLATPPAGGDGEQQLDALLHERDGLARDVAMLRSECDRLAAALHEAEAEKRQIREITETVARRLDGSIDELDRMLGD